MRPIIAALDVGLREALRVAGSLKDEVAGFKVGWDLVLESGLDAVRAVAKLGPTIVDLKLGDVPHIVSRVVEKLTSAGACCVIAHGVIRPSLGPDERIYLLVKMSAPSLYDRVWRDLLGEALGFRGVVLPANEPAVIAEARSRLGCGLRIISPGVGPQGGRPGGALEAGADFEIVGRYLLEDPRRVEEWPSKTSKCGFPEP